MTSDNSKFVRLINFLDEAEKLASAFSGGYSNNFLSAQEFHKALSDSIIKLKAGDIDQLNHLWRWFAPTCDWDDFIGKDGVKLANEIYELVAELKISFKVYTLIDLIIDYQSYVELVITAFKKEFNRTDLLMACKQDKIYPHVGSLKKYHIKSYAFHGIGLAVIFNDNTSVDFDFAFLPEQRHDGFDLWRLGIFVSSKPEKYKKYLDKNKLEGDFNALVERKVIVKPDINPSTSLYFFQSSLAKPKMSEKKSKKTWWKIWE